MNLLTSTEAAQKMGITRQAFSISILPLLARRGEARKFGGYWVVDGDDFWQWEVYAATRRNLIKAGIWIARRPWSIADLDECVHGEKYEDYGPTTAWPGEEQ